MTKPMHSDPDLLPTTLRATGDKLQCGLWDYSVAVVGKHKKKVPVGGSESYFVCCLRLSVQ